MIAIHCSLAVSFFRMRSAAPVSASEWWLIKLPISICSGWISIAAFANLTVALGSSDLPDPGISYAGLAGASVLSVVYASLSRRNFVYLCTIIWALTGIAVKNVGKNQTIVFAVTGAGLAVATATLAGRSQSHHRLRAEDAAD